VPMRPEHRTAGTPEAAGAAARPSGSDGALLSVEDLQVHFPLGGSFAQRLLGRQSGAVRAVDEVSFELAEGEVLGVVGESGSGKTTLGRALLGLTKPTGGSIRYRGRDITYLSERAFRPLRRKLQMVFQDPHASLNPSMDIETAVGHPLRIHGVASSRDEIAQRVRAALQRVGLTPVERFLGKHPGDLSGGQKQRAVLARAILLDPELLVADEPVSMLDMSVRAKILQLMLDLRRDLGLSYVYITHDLATAKFFCDRVAIMYLGRIVEIGPVEEIYADPKHPYTQALLRAIPEPDPDRAVPRDLPRGEIPDAAVPPLGCSFHPRCPHAFQVCGWEGRDLKALLDAHWVTLDPERYEEERALLADLDALDAPEQTVRLEAAQGRRGQDVAALLDRLRRADPDEPLWRGVESVEADDRGVSVRFLEAHDPGLLAVGAVRVACHLHDRGLVELSRRVAGGPEPAGWGTAP
jgi:oligopeptide/dipeptide ABC transporter ATP-binding protein